MSVKFINSDRLIRDIEKAPEQIDEALRKTLLEAGEDIQRRAKAKAPIETGALRESLKVRAGSKRAKPSVKVFADYPKTGRRRSNKTGKQKAGSREYYAFAVEYGTKTVPARPFLIPAAQEVEEQLPVKVEQALNNVLDKAF